METKTKITKSQKRILPKTLKARLFILTLAALTFAFATKYFIISTNLYSLGASGVAQGITYTIWDSTHSANNILLGLDEEAFKNTASWIFNIAFNIPIVAYTLFKYGRRFTLISLYTFLMAAAFSLFFTFTPGFNQSFINLENIKDENIVFLISIISALFGGVMAGFATGITFSQSASSLGVDPILKTLSREKGIELRKALFTFTIINSLFWTVTSEAINGNITSWDHFLQSTIFNPRTLSSLVLITLYSFTASVVYPSSSKYSIRIVTKQSDKISKLLKDINFHRAQTIFDVVGGHTGSKQKIVEIIVFNEEIQDLMQYVDEVDPNAFITSEPIKQIFTSASSTQQWRTWTKNDAFEAKDAQLMREKFKRNNNKNKKDI